MIIIRIAMGKVKLNKSYQAIWITTHIHDINIVNMINPIAINHIYLYSTITTLFQSFEKKNQIISEGNNTNTKEINDLVTPLVLYLFIVVLYQRYYLYFKVSFSNQGVYIHGENEVIHSKNAAKVIG